MRALLLGTVFYRYVFARLVFLFLIIGLTKQVNCNSLLLCKKMILKIMSRQSSCKRPYSCSLEVMASCPGINDCCNIKLQMVKCYFMHMVFEEEICFYYEQRLSNLTEQKKINTVG